MNKTILITGAGGSIGSELCREILRDSPKLLVLLELNEFSLYLVERKFRSLSSIPIVPCLGSVQDSELLKHLLRNHKINTVYHAAAYKHVPLVEENPLEGLSRCIDETPRSKTTPPISSLLVISLFFSISAKL